MEEALSNPGELHQWFECIKRWDVAECCDNRRVWIDILGVPPQGWKWENFKLIANLWGQLICLGKSTTNSKSYEAMRALIATDRFCRIDSEILLLVENCGYRVTIREIATVGQAVRKPSVSAPNISVDGNDSNNDSNREVPGFEDLEDDISNQGQSAGEESLKSQARLIAFSNSNSAEDERSLGINDSGHKVEVGIRSRSESKTNSNSRKDKESPQGYESSPNKASGSRTKLVSISQNGYSEELFKVGQLSRTKFNDEFNVESALALGVDLVAEGQQSSCEEEPPGFERGGFYQSINERPPAADAEMTPLEPVITEAGPTMDLESHLPLLLAQPRVRSHDQQPRDMVNDQGEVHSQQPGDVTSIHPGFEVNTKERVRLARQGRNSKIHVDCIGKRVTRSQSRQCKEQAGKSKSLRNKSVSGLQGRVESPYGSNSGDTTESMRKLAEDALELGELLGLKVVAHKKNAIKRITQSLKTARVPQSKH